MLKIKPIGGGLIVTHHRNEALIEACGIARGNNLSVSGEEKEMSNKYVIPML
jgi:hypothetical protein